MKETSAFTLILSHAFYWMLILVYRISGKTVNIEVGEMRESFIVHENLIRSSSFFDKAMSGEWKESSQRTIQLPDDEPGIIKLYIHWLYCGTLPVICGKPYGKEYTFLVKAYILGDKLLDTKFQNAAINAIVERSVTPYKDGIWYYPCGSLMTYVYDNSNESDRIRDLFVDLYAMYGKSTWLNSTYPNPFILKLASVLLELRGASKKKIEASEYHVHN